MNTFGWLLPTGFSSPVPCFGEDGHEFSQQLALLVLTLSWDWFKKTQQW